MKKPTSNQVKNGLIQLTRRNKSLFRRTNSMLLIMQMLLSACGDVSNTSTTQALNEPYPQASPKISLLEPSPTVQPGSALEQGKVVSLLPQLQTGETLSIGGVEWEFKKYNVEELISQLGENFAGWTIITDDNQDVYNLFHTDNQGGYSLVIPHSPQGYSLDEKNQLAVSTDGKEVIFQEVALPGGWNDEKQMAGQVAIPSLSILARSPEGKYQIIVVYSNEAVENNPSLNNPLTMTKSGDWAIMGVEKILFLTEGQRLEKDTDGVLRLINSDGSYYRILTSWDQLTVPEQVNELFKPKGVTTLEIDGQNIEVPYPPLSLQQEKGITDYGVLANGVIVAYQNDLVVASFTQNEWQPTIPLENLAIPDPRESNPELFDLTDSQAPIPQFNNTMRMAGIEVMRKEVVTGITYISTKNDGTPLVDKDGNPLVVAAYNLDPDPTQTGETLEGKTTLLLTKRNESGVYEWKPYTHGELASTVGIFTGISGSITGSLNSETLGEFNQIVLADALWKIPYSSSKSLFPREDKINPQPLIDAVNTAQRKYPSSELMVFHLNWGNHIALPDWLLNGYYTKNQYRQFMLDYVVQVMTPLKGKVKSWVVVNEPFSSPWDSANTGFWQKRLGPDNNWIIDVFQTAHNVDPNAKLILNDFGIEIPGENLYDPSKAAKIFNIVEKLKSKNIAVEVGFQMHLYGSQLSNPQMLQLILENFRKNIRKYRNIGVAVCITEWDIRMIGVGGSQQERMLKQATIYGALMKVALEEGVKSINFFGINDDKSWLEDPAVSGPNAKNADPTLKLNDLSLKPAWYVINQSLLEYLLGSSQ